MEKCRILDKAIRVIGNPYLRFAYISDLGLLNWMSDESFLKRKYYYKFGEKLSLEKPVTFNEKLQWLKIYDHNPAYTMMVDKYRVRNYITSKIGKEYLVPLVGVWDKPDDIDFSLLPNKFVLKCNHNSGKGICICKDKDKLNIKKVKKELAKGLKQNYYYHGREWPYKDVPRKIICEEFLDNNGRDLLDYKLMCFNGKVQCSFVCTDRFSKNGLHVTFFDRDWNVMPFERHYPSYKQGLPKPRQYYKMIELAETLAEKIPFVRVDFYEIEGKIYFGELTFFPGSGFEEFTPKEWDVKLGNLLMLPT